MAINKININPCIIYKALPLAFDESLSYLEQLCAFSKKLNELIPIVNHNSEIIETIDINFQEIQRQIDELTVLVNSISTNIFNVVDNKLANHTSQITSLLNDYQAIFKQYTDNQINIVNQRIDNIEIGNIRVYDPTTGQLNYIGTVIQNVYDSTRYNAITCTEFDELELTATEFDAYNITAYNFDNNSKTILI